MSPSPDLLPHPKPPTPPPADIYRSREEASRREQRGFSTSLAVAVAVHLVLLAVALPKLGSLELEPPDDRRVILLPTPRFEPPPPAPEELPPERTQRQPIPDPDPDAPEPVVRHEVDLQLDDLPLADDLTLFIPDAPPDPPPSRPIRVGRGVRRPPERIHYVAPQYTEMARRVREQGTVVVEAVIDREGRVTDLTVVAGLRFGLTEAAVQAVRQWRFRPYTLNGKPVAVVYVVRVHFQLR